MSKNPLFTPDQYRALVSLKSDDRLRGLLLGFARGKEYHSVENRVGAWNVAMGPNDFSYRLHSAMNAIGFTPSTYSALRNAFIAWATPKPENVVPCNRKFYRRTDPRHPEYGISRGATAEVAVACEAVLHPQG